MWSCLMSTQENRLDGEVGRRHDLGLLRRTERVAQPGLVEVGFLLVLDLRLT